eukprot:CAMPEP_0202688822 /NCGR_PEP_ID=MMETSP1385-20130828/4241_1 /ASSEMBLY_ACC=CAM_ASM_000861 /TAXON_ID=933848 /ORGANISM="Elphidium margaritaceum" /LENGTH=225 /DNA_ID=CAMNT_0049343869 /DNA_START=23 /DNA_END=698 /DNA_ORIENTATION=+
MAFESPKLKMKTSASLSDGDSAFNMLRTRIGSTAASVIKAEPSMTTTMTKYDQVIDAPHELHGVFDIQFPPSLSNIKAGPSALSVTSPMETGELGNDESMLLLTPDKIRTSTGSMSMSVDNEDSVDYKTMCDGGGLQRSSQCKLNKKAHVTPPQQPMTVKTYSYEDIVASDDFNRSDCEENNRSTTTLKSTQQLETKKKKTKKDSKFAIVFVFVFESLDDRQYVV